MARSYSDETKAAVMAALLAGQSINSAAREYNIPKGTVSRWKAEAREVGGVRSERTQKDEVGPLLVDYLKANLRTLKAQVEVFGDPDWLREKDAQEAAVLHGILTDKAVRLLEAFGRETDSDVPDDAGD